MADLTIGVDGTRAAAGSRVVTRSLNDIRGAAARTGRSVGQLSNKMKAASTTAALLRRAMTGLGAGLLAREFVRLSDSFTNTTNRLKLVTDGHFELKAVQEELFTISQQTRTSFEANATLFNRLALSAKDLGVSLDDVLSVTKSLNQAVILSGAATTEASQGLLQLSQGVASNRLSGDELRSVLEQLPVVADVIAKQLGVTRGELKFFGEQGKISADTVFKAFANAREELEQRFGETVPTVAQSFVILRNAAIRFIGNLNESTGIVTNLSGLIIGIANNFETWAKGIAVVAAGLGPLVLGRAISVTALAIRGLTALMLRNPFVLLAAGIASATAAAIAFGDEPLGDVAEDAADGFSNTAAEVLGLTQAIEDGVIPAQTTWADVAKATLQAAIDWTKETAMFFINAWKEAVNKLLGFFGIANQGWASIFNTGKMVMNKVIGLMVGVVRAMRFIWDSFWEYFIGQWKKVFFFYEPIILAIGDLARQVFNTLKKWAGQLFGWLGGKVDEVLDDVRTETGITSFLVDETVIAVKEAKQFGIDVGEAFMSGMDQDYVGAFTEFMAPAWEGIIQQSGEIAGTRLADQAARVAGQQGVDLSEKTEGAQIIRPEDQRLINKFLKETQTPLEKFQTTLETINRLQAFDLPVDQAEALVRALDEAKTERISEEFEALGLDDLETVMEEAIPAIDRYNLALEGLDVLLKDNVISQDQFNAAVENAKEKILGLADITKTLTEEMAKNVQSAFADFLFDPFEDGLDGMLKSFGETLRRMLSELLAKQILISFLNSVAGAAGSGSAVGNIANAAIGAISSNASGGPIRAGETSIVGENGPEIFTPKQSGAIVPNDRIGGGQAPQVTVMPAPVVVLDDPKKVEQALQSANGQRALVTAIGEKSSSVNQALQRNQ